MAGGKETPRQKMIGMMYLVLTALLALNISKEVLNGFVKVEKSLRVTQGTLSGKVKETMGELEAKYATNKEKVQPFMTQAQELNKRAAELLTYITQLKARAMSASVGDYKEQEAKGFSTYLGKDEFGNDTTLSLSYIDKKDEYQNLTAFMVGSEPHAPRQDEYSAHALRVKMEEFREYIKAIKFKDNLGNTRELPDYIKTQVDAAFRFEKEMEDGKEVLWETANFFDMPLAAVMPLMTKMTLDIQDAQEDILAWLLSGVDARSYKFTKLIPIVVPDQTYIVKGDSMKADILLAAYDETNSPQIILGNSNFTGTKPSGNVQGTQLRIAENGLGLFRKTTSGMPTGEVRYEGVIRYQGPDGAIESFPFVTPKFTIADAALVVDNLDMLTIYKGFANRLSVSIPGVAPDKITVNAGGAAVSKTGPGVYTVKPSATGEITLDVTGEMPDGSKRNMKKKYKVKVLPPDEAAWGERQGGPLTRGQAKAAFGARPRLTTKRPPGFELEYNARITSFVLEVSRSEGAPLRLTSTSDAITAEMQKTISQLPSGTYFRFTAIKGENPSGAFNAKDIAFTIQ
jgi:gliding motility-associated protein GldM